MFIKFKIFGKKMREIISDDPIDDWNERILKERMWNEIFEEMNRFYQGGWAYNIKSLVPIIVDKTTGQIGFQSIDYGFDEDE